MTDLRDSMSLHKPGQLTWPEPDVGAWCETCVFFDQGNDISVSRKESGYGRCGLVRLHQKVKGVQFIGNEAIACPKYEKDPRK